MFHNENGITEEKESNILVLNIQRKWFPEMEKT